MWLTHLVVCRFSLPNGSPKVPWDIFVTLWFCGDPTPVRRFSIVRPLTRLSFWGVRLPLTRPRGCGWCSRIRCAPYILTKGFERHIQSKRQRSPLQTAQAMTMSIHIPIRGTRLGTLAEIEAGSSGYELRVPQRSVTLTPMGGRSL